MGMDTGSLSTNISISEFIYFSSSKYLIVFYIDDYSVRTVWTHFLFLLIRGIATDFMWTGLMLSFAGDLLGNDTVDLI